MCNETSVSESLGKEILWSMNGCQLHVSAVSYIHCAIHFPLYMLQLIFSSAKFYSSFVLNSLSYITIAKLKEEK